MYAPQLLSVCTVNLNIWTPKTIVKIDPGKPARLLAAANAAAAAPTKKGPSRLPAARLSDLPKEAQSRWSSHFCPTFLYFLGSIPNPFLTENLAEDLQPIWNVVYPNIKHQVEGRGATVNLVSSNLILILTFR